MEEKGIIKNLFHLFEMFSRAAMNPRPYVKKQPMPATVTVPLGPEEMEVLQIIAARIGAPRTMVAHHILKFGIFEAARGCGFDFDEKGKIPESQLKWDTTPRPMGFSHIGEEEAA